LVFYWLYQNTKGRFCDTVTKMSESLILLGLPFSNECGDSTPSAQFQFITRRLGPVGQALRQFVIPPLKVGTLDSLMEASDDLAKLDPQCEGTVLKLISLMEEASQKPRRDVSVLRISQSQEMTADGYLKHFQWNASQFDTKENIRTLVERMGLVASGAEERVRQVLTDYSDTRSKLAAASRKNQGSLAIRPLGELVEKWGSKNAIVDTELLVTLFVAVPVASQKEWLTTYWQINDFVCPHSSTVIADDKEFVLNSVVLFKKVADDFKLGCRKRKFIVRDFTVSEEVTADELRALTQKAEQERTALLALLSQQYSLCYVAWIHIKALRVFVECMLKYGLPPRFVGVALAVDDRKEAEIRQKIAAAFPNLKNQFSDEHHDTGALQHEFPYVSLKVANVLKV
jgi:V-type H+-transporting ATPase subunit C